MTLPAQNISMPAPDAPVRARRVKGEYTLLDNDLISSLLRSADGKTRVLVALAQQDNYTRKKGLTHAELMVKTGLSASAVEKAVRVLKAEGRCELQSGMYCYARPTGPRLAAPAEKRGRYDRQQARARRAAQAQEPHTCPDKRPDTYPYNYTVSAPENAAPDGEFSPLKEVEGSLYISTTTSTDTRVKEDQVDVPSVAEATAEVVVAGDPQADELHPPVGGTADAVRADTSLPVQDYADQDTEIQEKITTDTEDFPPAAALVSPRARRETAAPAGLNSLLWADWNAAFGTVQDADLTGTWVRWVDHVGAGASQQLALAEQWATWIRAGLADALRVQVPETIGDTKVLNPTRHLAGAMSKRADEARRNPVPTSAPAAKVDPGAVPQAGERRVDPRTGEIWTVESVACGQVTFEEVEAPTDLRVSLVASWEVAQ